MAKDDAPYADLGERLRAVRERIGDTQKMMSSRLSLGPTTWQRLEAGANVPSGETLLTIASLGINPTWVLTGQGDMRLEQDQPPAQGQESAGPAIDGELLGRINDVIMRTYKEMGVALAAIDLGRLAATHYARIAAASEDPDERLIMVKMIRGDVRAAIQSAAAEPGKGKASA